MYPNTSVSRRRSVALLAIVTAAIGGCEDDPVAPARDFGASPTGTLSANLPGNLPESPGYPTRVLLCHRTEGTVGYVAIFIASPSVPAHLQHGDGAPGDPVPELPGMVFNDACNPVPANQLLFENGSSSGPQSNFANTAGNQRLFEDFSVEEGVRITRIAWQQHDHYQATYVSTEVQVFEGLPYDGSPVYRAIVTATRVPNETGTLFDAWEGFDYEIDNLSIDLPPGEYWLGLNERFQGIRSGWDNTTGGPNTIPGFRVINRNYPPPGSVANGNLAFSLFGYVR